MALYKPYPGPIQLWAMLAMSVHEKSIQPHSLKSNSDGLNSTFSSLIVFFLIYLFISRRAERKIPFLTAYNTGGAGPILLPLHKDWQERLCSPQGAILKIALIVSHTGKIDSGCAVV